MSPTVITVGIRMCHVLVCKWPGSNKGTCNGQLVNTLQSQSKVQNNVYVRNKHIPLNSTVEYV